MIVDCPYCRGTITYLDVEDQWDFAENPHAGIFAMPCPNCHGWLDVEVSTKPIFTILKTGRD